MQDVRRLLRVMAGAFLFAIVLFALIAAPGFLTDEASTGSATSVTREIPR